ncbi:MAG: hypothetical protein J3K34DRAFT_409697 [Monoraphidium minutum]|nr:MAG: hypothetical protein J3K34DRAFT_409697 [Monoraphidium minutum]
MASLHGMQQLAQQSGAAGRAHPRAFAPFSSRPGRAPGVGARWARLQRLRAADAGALGGEDEQQQQAAPAGRPEAPYDLKPFPRRRESNPYRLLGVEQEASFDEIQDARNYLFERYKWDEPSREAIEAAFDTLLQTHYKQRQTTGFQPAGLRGARSARARAHPTRLTTRTIINEGAVFGAFALWVLFSSDPSFPLASTLVYCVYQFQAKRVKRDPDGPFILNNPLLGAVLSTLCCLGIACGVMALAAAPLAVVMGQSARQVGAFVTIVVMGVLGVWLK